MGSRGISGIEVKYCVNCGASVTTEKFCSECGAPIGVRSAGVAEASKLSDVPVHASAVSEQPGVPSLPQETSAQPEVPVSKPRAKNVFTSIEPVRWIASAVGGALAYAAAWVVTLLIVLLALFSLTVVPVDWSWVLLLPAQIVGLSLGGTFTAGTTVLGVSASISLLWVPLLVTALVITGVAFLARRDEKLHPTATRGGRWLLSAATGLVLAVVSTLFAAILRPEFSTGGLGSSMLNLGSVTVAGTSASFSLFAGALVIGALVAYGARARVAPKVSVSTSAGKFHAAAIAGIPVVVLYLVISGIVLGVALLVTIAVTSGPATLLASPLWLPTLVVDGFALVLFSVITLTGPLASLPGFSALDTAISLPGTFPGWVVLVAVVVNLVLIVFIGLVLRLRRRVNGPAVAVNWLTTVGLFAILGVAVSLLGSAALWSHVDASALNPGGAAPNLLGIGSSMLAGLASTSMSVGPAVWTFFVFAVFGALVEVSALWVAPFLLASVPAPVVERMGRILGRVGVPVLASTASGIDPVPVTPERRRLVVAIAGIAGGVVALIILGAVSISVLNSTVFSPQNEVDGYLNSIEAKDASQAISRGGIEVSSSDQVLLTNKVLAATSSGVTSHRVISSESAEDVASVAVELRQLGDKSTTAFMLHRAGKSWLFFDVWKLDAVKLPELAISVPSGVNSVVVNGATVAISQKAQDDGFLQLPVFPGTYTASLTDDNKWVTAVPDKTTVGMNGLVASEPAQLTLNLEPTDDFTKEVSAQVSEMLTRCAASTDIAPEGCPFRYYSFGSTTAVSWALGTAPTFHLDQSNGGGWTVVTDNQGSATVTYTSTFFGSYTDSYKASFYVDGEVAFADGKPSYTYGG